MPQIKRSFNSLIKTEFKVIWSLKDLQPNPDLVAWVPNPGQDFIIDEAILEKYKRLRVIVTPSTGSNHINKNACKNFGVEVFSLLDDRSGLENISASAEFSFNLILHCLRKMDLALEEVKAGRWRENEDALRGRELQGKTVGLIGYGRIGRRLDKYCRAFDAHMCIYDPYVDQDHRFVRDLQKIFTNCDIVVCCCALTQETNAMLDDNLFCKLKKGAMFINSARGEIINEIMLAEVIEKRPDIRVAVDVLSGEVSGTQFSSPLIKFQKSGQVIISPHIAGATLESQEKAAFISLSLLQRFLNF